MNINLLPSGLASDLEYRPGIYFLLDYDGTVVYVGKSVSPEARVATGHPSKLFSRAAVVRIDNKDELVTYEAGFINLFKPFYNKGRRNSRTKRKRLIYPIDKRKVPAARKLVERMLSQHTKEGSV
jgi:excinuclease UvrABC nuclease subunit